MSNWFLKRALPADFDRQGYLQLNPDVASAQISPEKHYVKFGRAEGRRYLLGQDESSAASEFAEGFPTDQSIVDIFGGEWSSSFPPSSKLVTTEGNAGLFEDLRIHELEKRLGPVAGASVLELGPLEAAHTYMLHQMGAESITAIETNKRAFLKCLAVKEIFELQRAKFLLGDGIEFLENANQDFDIILASGVLYHMTDPLRFLEALVAHSDKIFLWTQYYDQDIFRTREDAKFFDAPHALDADETMFGAKRIYPEQALSWTGFSGGHQPYAVWMTRQSIIDFFEKNGFSKLDFSSEDPNHPNGPAFAISASR